MRRDGPNPGAVGLAKTEAAHPYFENPRVELEFQTLEMVLVPDRFVFIPLIQRASSILGLMLQGRLT